MGRGERACSLRRSFVCVIAASSALILLTFLLLDANKFYASDRNRADKLPKQITPIHSAISHESVKNVKRENGTILRRFDAREEVSAEFYWRQESRKRTVDRFCNLDNKRNHYALPYSNDIPKEQAEVLSDLKLGLPFQNHSDEVDDVVPKDFRAILVDDDFRILYCSVPKVACTNWMRVLLMLTGRMNVSRMEDLASADVHNFLEGRYLKRLDRYSSEEIRYRLRTYDKFLFVREPFERLLSAYRNKFTMPYNTYFTSRIGRRIIKLYRKNPTKKSLSGGKDVTFDEFVRYMVDPKTTERHSFNPHWRPFHQLCLPCRVNYDFIGKYETLQEDADFVVKQLGFGKTARFPRQPAGRVKTSDILSQHFSNVSDRDVESLWNLFQRDYELFGYSKPKLVKNRFR